MAYTLKFSYIVNMIRKTCANLPTSFAGAASTAAVRTEKTTYARRIFGTGIGLWRWFLVLELKSKAGRFVNVWEIFLKAIRKTGGAC